MSAPACPTDLWQFALAHGLLIGLFGTSATFGPLMADVSHWFRRRRGTAVAIAASGNYLAGTVWPGVVQHFIDTVGWRADLHRHRVVLPHHDAAVGIVSCAAASPEPATAARAVAGDGTWHNALGLSPAALQTLLCIAGVACCVAMSMPQVQMVAYCGDLGYGVARGAEMLSLMMGFGIVSRIGIGLDLPTASAGWRPCCWVRRCREFAYCYISCSTD